MRRAAFQANVLERPIEPHNDAQRRHGTTAPGLSHVFRSRRDLTPGNKSGTEIRMNGDYAATALLGRMVMQFDRIADPTTGIHHHIPRQVGNLARAQASFSGEQDENAVAQRIASATGIGISQPIQRPIRACARHGVLHNFASAEA